MLVAVLGPSTRASGVSSVTATRSPTRPSLHPCLERDTAGPAAVPGDLDRRMDRGQVGADGVAERLVRTHHQRRELAATGEEAVEELAGHGGEVLAHDQDLA